MKSSRCASNRRCRPASTVGDEYPGQLGPRAVKHGDVSDPVHEGAARAARERAEQLVPSLAVTARSLDLDELVIVEGARSLRGDRVRQSRAPQAHDGLQGMVETAQVTPLALRELGGGGVFGSGCGVRLLHRRIVGGWNLDGCAAN